MKKGRMQDNKGEKHSKSKLTEKAILEIRRLRHDEKMTLKEIAQKFNVHYSTVGYVLQRKLWSHI